MLKKILTVTCITLLSGSAVIANAQDKGPHDDAIKARKALMQLYGYSTGVLGAMAKGKMDYDAEIAQEMADNLNAAVNMGQSTMWPAGSDNETAGNAKNRALPAIWETYPAIVEKSEAMAKAAENLQANAGGGLDALRGAIGDAGKACKACHDDYRASRR